MITLNRLPPFSYTWQVQQDGQVIANGAQPPPIYTATSNFQVCLPPSVATGSAELVICTVSDAFCTNNQ